LEDYERYFVSSGYRNVQYKFIGSTKVKTCQIPDDYADFNEDPNGQWEYTGNELAAVIKEMMED